ncbi:MAG: TIGR02530 family flagellar biosynthesis protein [Oscillospiraceae bacterium]
MADINFNQPFRPIVTGNVSIGSPSFTTPNSVNPQQGPKFDEVLAKQISSLTFSKHAVSRVSERGMDVSEDNLKRLNEGVRLAQNKGLDDALILIDANAFVVSTKNSTVITAVGGDDLTGNVFTNIDGTVII